MKLEEYNPSMQLQKWNPKWEEDEIYKWDSNARREESYVIDTPPPTVSGLLHMGHIFSYTQADFIARYQRMKGKTVCYPIGFDDNGLPTERLVEKVKNIRATSMSRSDFVEVCKEVVKESEEEFRNLFKSVGLSFDWNLEYQTISKDSQKISQMSFLDMVAKNRVYRKMQPTLWDVVDQTALAQADIEDKEQTSMMNDIRFTTTEGQDIIIATTRPELIPACVAIMYNPNDERYKILADKKAVTALFKAEVPFVADELVDMEKGTGLVMCCTFGDITDTIWWKKHNLDTKVILDKYGKISNLDFFETEEAKNYAEMIRGLKVKEARSKIIEILKEQNLILKQVETKPMVKCAERSGAPIEIIVTPQWFVQILDRKEQLLEKAAKCNWHPNYMKIRLDNWINGLNWDWCISRQRFFGVPFPVWYSKRPGEEGKVLFASKEQLPIDPLVDLPLGYTKDEVEPDYDVMDTWATSSVSPQLTSFGINDQFYVDLDRHKKLFPADLRPQAHEIIRTWAFYTIVKADVHEDNIPWKDLMISGWCLAADKTKMSKSKGNVVTPTKLIEEKGTDIVRYWASTSRLGADTAYSEDVLKIGKKLVNKIWNASKFAAIHLEKIKSKPASIKDLIKNKVIKNSIDLWLLSKLAAVVEKATSEFERLEYCIARTHIEEFFYKDFCDNYLELVKVRAYDEKGQDEAGSMSAIYTIYHTLSTLLKLFAPFIPYITEEIYSVLFAKYEENFKSIHAQNMWPKTTNFEVIDSAVLDGKVAIDILDVIRKIKAEQNISLKAEVKEILIINNSQKNYSDIVPKIKNDLINVTNALKIEIIDDSDRLENIYHTEDGEMKLAVQL